MVNLIISSGQEPVKHAGSQPIALLAVPWLPGGIAAPTPSTITAHGCSGGQGLYFCAPMLETLGNVIYVLRPCLSFSSLFIYYLSLLCL